jgi:WhiB family redox-sensing transcriptional regulator
MTTTEPRTPRDRTPRLRESASLVIHRVDVSWMDRAACRDEEPELFFTGGDHDMTDQWRTIEARSVCRLCPVQVECLRYAIAIKADGVWAGTTPQQRKALEPKQATA